MAIVSILVLAIAVALWLKRQPAIDICLDGGGSWNYASSQCEKQ